MARTRGQEAHASSTMAIRLLVPQVILLLAVVGASLGFSSLAGRHSDEINEIGKIRGGIQRYVKLCLLGEPYAEGFADISGRIDAALQFEKANSLLFSDRDVRQVEDLAQVFEELYAALPRAAFEPGPVLVLSERTWSKADLIVTAIETRTRDFIRLSGLVSYAILAAIIVMGLVLYILKFRIQAGVEVHAARDPLTGLYNRTYLRDFHRSLARQQDDQGLWAIMGDIDHFKAVNDDFGHAEGDRVLRGVAAILLDTCRSDDRVVRYGGEEFLVLARFPGIEAARRLAERIRAEVEGTAILTRPLTMSLGVAKALPGEDVEHLMERADGALYRSKKAGRNRVTVAAEG